MQETCVTATELRNRATKLVKDIEQGRIGVTWHGQMRAYLISARELAALEETIAILENDELMKSLIRGLNDVNAGRVKKARDAFAELDAEFPDDGDERLARL